MDTIELTDTGFECLVARLEEERASFQLAVAVSEEERQQFGAAASGIAELLQELRRLHAKFRAAEQRGGPGVGLSAFTDRECGRLQYFGFDVRRPRGHPPLVRAPASPEGSRPYEPPHHQRLLALEQLLVEERQQVQAEKRALASQADHARRVELLLEEKAIMTEEILHLRYLLLSQQPQLLVAPKPDGATALVLRGVTEAQPIDVDSARAALNSIRAALQGLQRTLDTSVFGASSRADEDGGCCDAGAAALDAQGGSPPLPDQSVQEALRLWRSIKDDDNGRAAYTLPSRAAHDYAEDRRTAAVDAAIVSLLNTLNFPLPVSIRRLGAGGDYVIDQRVHIKLNRFGQLVVRERRQAPRENCSRCAAASKLPEASPSGKYVLLHSYLFHLYSPALDLGRLESPNRTLGIDCGHVLPRPLSNRPESVSSRATALPECGAVGDGKDGGHSSQRIDALRTLHAQLQSRLRQHQDLLRLHHAAAAQRCESPSPEEGQPVPRGTLHDGRSEVRELSCEHHSRRASTLKQRGRRYPPSPSPETSESDMHATDAGASHGHSLRQSLAERGEKPVGGQQRPTPFERGGPQGRGTWGGRVESDVLSRVYGRHCSETLSSALASTITAHDAAGSADDSAVVAAGQNILDSFSPRVRDVLATMSAAGSTLPDLSSLSAKELQELRDATLHLSRS